MTRSTIILAAACLTGFGAIAGAQSAPKQRHPAVCAEGVRLYDSRAKLPAKRDSIPVPPPPGGGQIRVSSPEEAEAAQAALIARAAGVGITSLLITTETEADADGGERMRRSVAGFFIAEDSVRAAGICKK